MGLIAQFLVKTIHPIFNYVQTLNKYYISYQVNFSTHHALTQISISTGMLYYCALNLKQKNTVFDSVFFGQIKSYQATNKLSTCINLQA